MKDRKYDELLNVKTTGHQWGFNASPHLHRYEATPYELLDQLFESYRMKHTDRLVDFGCGKGRLNFYVHYVFGAEAVGVEMDEGLYRKALENRTQYEKKFKQAKGKLHFECCLAQDYEVDERDNRFYFFNPFSVQLFMAVVQNILRSVEQAGREVDLILFFPSHDYIDFLERSTPFELFEEIVLPKAEKEVRERFLVYRLA